MAPVFLLKVVPAQVIAFIRQVSSRLNLELPLSVNRLKPLPSLPFIAPHRTPQYHHIRLYLGKQLALKIVVKLRCTIVVSHEQFRPQ